jgi:DNA-directed RNA polymerase subunit RPC12/RpoP
MKIKCPHCEAKLIYKVKSRVDNTVIYNSPTFVAARNQYERFASCRLCGEFWMDIFPFSHSEKIEV